jgi:hypothetical protein
MHFGNFTELADNLTWGNYGITSSFFLRSTYCTVTVTVPVFVITPDVAVTVMM